MAGRVGLIVVVVLAPTCLLALSGDKSSTGFAFISAVSILAAIVGIEIAVVRPLRTVQQAVDAWQSGTDFKAGHVRDLPTELRAFSLSFKRAARDLRLREQQLQTAKERQDLAMQEIHHRVKNNLQVVASLLNLQASRIRLPAAKAEFQSARDRVKALATVHRHLYAHGDVHTINMRMFLFELCEQLFQAMGETPGERLALDIDAPELEMSSDQAVPLSLIVTEAVTNAIKYAYPDRRRGTISVQLRHAGGALELDISDDGIGLMAGRAETEAGTRDGIGIQLINGFSRQLGAALEVEQGKGTRYRVRMNLHPGRAGANGIAAEAGASASS